jgi:D-3-phosphoglycerate dehydrogenase
MVTDLGTLLSQSDIVTLHVPLVEATRNLIDSVAFTQMRQGVLIINAARGGVVDEVALIDALATGKVAGAAIDVFDQEPPRKDNPLFRHPTVLATPHIAGATRDALRRLSVGAAAGILTALSGGRPPRMVDDIWPPARLIVEHWPVAFAFDAAVG